MPASQERGRSRRCDAAHLRLALPRALAFLAVDGVRPWQLTLLSLALNVAVEALIVTGDWLVAGVLLLFAGLCDVFDGSVARHRGEAKRSGAFMDSVLDRVADMILFSCLFWALAANGVRSSRPRWRSSPSS